MPSLAIIRHALLVSLLAFLLATPSYSFGEIAEPSPSTTLTFSFQKQTFSFDPSRIISVFESQLHQALYDTLVRLDTNSYDVKPGVAIAWNISEDGLNYRFNLRGDAKFSDGSTITADDVVHSFLRLLKNESSFTFLLSPIVGVENYLAEQGTLDEVHIKALNPRVLEIRLKNPTPHFLKTITHAAFSIISKTQDYEQNFEELSAQNIVVSGAYKIQSYNLDESLVLIANQNYWSRDKMKNESVIIYFVDGDDYDYVITDFNRLLIHWTDLPLSEFELKEADSIQVNRTYGTEFLYFNTALSPWNNAKVRRAIRLLLPLKSLKEESYSLPGDELISLPNYNSLSHKIDEDLDASLSADEQAYTLLEEEGYPRGKGLGSLIFLIPEYGSGEFDPIYTKISTILSNKLSTEIELRPIKYSDLHSAQKTQNYAVTVFSWIGDFADPMAFLQLFYSKNDAMGINYVDQNYRDLIDTANSANDSSRYNKLALAELQLLRDTVIIPLRYSFSVHYISPSLKGWFPNILEIYPYEHMYTEYGEIPDTIAGITRHKPKI